MNALVNVEMKCMILEVLEGHQGLWQVGNDVKEKLLELLPKTFREEIEDFQKRVAISQNSAIDYGEMGELFKKLNTAIRNGRQMLMEYNSFSSNELTCRTVDPYQLIFQDGFWYLVAFCHRREAVRLFRVDRIVSLKVDVGQFEVPGDFNIQEYMGSAWQMERGHEFIFKVRFRGEAARFIEETQFHSTQTVIKETDNTVLFSAKACGLNSIARWVLGFGSAAEVLEPIELQELVVRELREALQGYHGVKRESEH